MVAVSIKSVAGILVSGSLVMSSTAAVASTSSSFAAPQLNPWAALAALSGGAPAVAMCGAAVAAAAAQPSAGCVLPQTDAPPPVAQSGPPQPIPVPPVEAAGGGLGIDPLLIALGVLAAGAGLYLVLHDSGDNNNNNSPA